MSIEEVDATLAAPQVGDGKTLQKAKGKKVLEDRQLVYAHGLLSSMLDLRQAKSDVLVNALAVFVQKGIVGTTVQDLLDAAKISRRTFYKYFRNKMDVLDAIYQLFVDTLLLRLQAEAERESPDQHITDQLIDAYFDYHLDLGAIISVLHEESLNSDSLLAPHRKRVQVELLRIFQKFHLKLSKQQIDPHLIFCLIWSMENTVLYLLQEAGISQERAYACKSNIKALSNALLFSATQVGVNSGGDAEPSL
jgi:AcrR family transcriptional regulator